MEFIVFMLDVYIFGLTVAILTSIVHQTNCIHIDKHDRRQSGIDTAQVCVLKQAHALWPPRESFK